MSDQRTSPVRQSMRQTAMQTSLFVSDSVKEESGRWLTASNANSNGRNYAPPAAFLKSPPAVKVFSQPKVNRTGLRTFHGGAFATTITSFSAAARTRFP